MKVRTSRNAGTPTRVDWSRDLITIRKPRDAAIVSDTICFAHHKRDGNRVVLAGKSVFTTAGHDIADALRGLIGLPDAGFPNGVTVDAELCAVGLGREAVKTAVAQGHVDRLVLNVFAVSGPGCPALLRDLPDWCRPRKLNWDEVVPYTPGDDPRVGLNSATHDGVVLKDPWIYGDWVKRKHRLTADVVVTGVKLGVGKYWGQIGSLVVSELHDDGSVGDVLANVSGMDDRARLEATVAHAARDLIGRVCEIAYEKVGTRGRLQHPRFIAWRDGIDAKL